MENIESNLDLDGFLVSKVITILMHKLTKDLHVFPKVTKKKKKIKFTILN